MISRIFSIVSKNPCTAVKLLKVQDDEEITLLIAFNQSATKIKSIQHKIFKSLVEHLNTALVDQTTMSQLMVTTLKHSTSYIKLRDTIISKLDDLDGDENEELGKAITKWSDKQTPLLFLIC